MHNIFWTECVLDNKKVVVPDKVPWRLINGVFIGWIVVEMRLSYSACGASYTHNTYSGTQILALTAIVGALMYIYIFLFPMYIQASSPSYNIIHII